MHDNQAGLGSAGTPGKGFTGPAVAKSSPGAMPTFEDRVNNLRYTIKGVARGLNLLKKAHAPSNVADKEDRGEVMANITLAYRHLEDASMRMGKVLQAFDGGVSVYDKETTVGVE